MGKVTIFPVFLQILFHVTSRKVTFRKVFVTIIVIYAEKVKKLSDRFPAASSLQNKLLMIILLKQIM